MRPPCSTLLALSTAVLALAGCSGPEEQRAAAEESTPPAPPPSSPEATETPTASIIRPDVAPNPVVDLPPDPLTMTIAFPEGSALSDTATRELERVLQSDALAEGWPIVLRGHSDSSGGDAVNLTASRKRAEAVAAWLTERGVAPERIRIIAFGEQNPVAPNARPDGTPDEEGRARNRRVELAIASPSETPPDPRQTREAESAQEGDSPR